MIRVGVYISLTVLSYFLKNLLNWIRTVLEV